MVIDFNNAFMTPIHHPVSAIVYSALGNEVTTVMIDGQFVMRDGVVTQSERSGSAAAGPKPRRRSRAALWLRQIQEAPVALHGGLLKMGGLQPAGVSPRKCHINQNPQAEARATKI